MMLNADFRTIFVFLLRLAFQYVACCAALTARRQDLNPQISLRGCI